MQERQHITPLSEETLEEQLEKKVEPYLKNLVQTGKLHGTNYYELYPLEEPAGTVVISFGFTESCRKYHEFIYYLLSRISVRHFRAQGAWLFHQRGKGSGRGAH